MTSTSIDRRNTLASSLAFKAPVRGVCTVNINLTTNALSPVTTSDGSITPVAGDRFLLMAQTDATENLIYIANTGTWTLDLDSDDPADLTKGTVVLTQSGQSWFCNAGNPITPGSTSVYWSRSFFNQTDFNSTPLTVGSKSLAQGLNGTAQSFIIISGADGGLFRRDSSDTSSAEDGGSYCGTIIRPADYATNGVFKRVNNSPLSPLWYGAKGTGLVDDSAAFNLIGATTQNACAIDAGYSYKISNNATVGQIIGRGGSISIDTSKTLTVQTVDCHESTRIFYGAGTVIINDHSYSLGWFDGADLSSKWDFCRRGFNAASDWWYTIKVPHPRSDDPAAIQGTDASITPVRNLGSSYFWKVTAPLLFNNPENQAIIYWEGGAVATATIATGMLEFSTTAKTEDIIFPDGANLFGNLNAASAVLLHGGARIFFNGRLTADDCTDANVIVTNDNYGVDECHIDFLEATGYANSGLRFHGVTNAAGGLSNCVVKEVLSNGGKVGGTPTNTVRMLGNLRGVEIHKITENIGGSYTSSSEAVIGWYADSAGAAAYGCVSGRVYGLNTTCPTGTKLADTSSGTATTKHGVLIQRNSMPLVSTPPYVVAWANGAAITEGIGDVVDRHVSGQVTIDQTTCSTITINGIPRQQVVGNCDTLRINGSYSFFVTLPSDGTAASVATYRCSGPSQAPNGLVNLNCTGDANQWAQGTARNGGAWVNTASGSATDFSTSVLSGATGTNGHSTLSINGNNLYLENRSGSSRTYSLTFWADA